MKFDNKSFSFIQIPETQFLESDIAGLTPPKNSRLSVRVWDTDNSCTAYYNKHFSLIDQLKEFILPNSGLQDKNYDIFWWKYVFHQTTSAYTILARHGGERDTEVVFAQWHSRRVCFEQFCLACRWKILFPRWHVEEKKRTEKWKGGTPSELPCSWNGTWQRRGFISKNGVFMVLSADRENSKVIDTVTLNLL